MTHTPGPWTVDGDDIYASGLIVAQASFRLEQCAANARLIAAAPDLLAALEGLEALENTIGSCKECYTCTGHETPAGDASEQARAAIAAAKGEANV